MRIIVNMITIIVLLVCVALNIGATVYEHKTTYPKTAAHLSPRARAAYAYHAESKLVYIGNAIQVRPSPPQKSKI